MTQLEEMGLMEDKDHNGGEVDLALSSVGLQI